jgi:hypothetical protein
MGISAQHVAGQLPKVLPAIINFGGRDTRGRSSLHLFFQRLTDAISLAVVASKIGV